MKYSLRQTDDNGSFVVDAERFFPLKRKKTAHLLITLNLVTLVLTKEGHCETEKCGISRNQDWVLMVSVSQAYEQFFQNWL